MQPGVLCGDFIVHVHRNAATRLAGFAVLLLLPIIAVSTPRPVGAAQMRPVADSSRTTFCAPATALLTVHVVYTLVGGAAPPPGVNLPTPQGRGAANIEVDVVAAGDGSSAPVATATTDATGSVEFDLPRRRTGCL